MYLVILRDHSENIKESETIDSYLNFTKGKNKSNQNCENVDDVDTDFCTCT